MAGDVVPFDIALRGISQRATPTNLQAEQAVLGGILCDNRALGQFDTFLRAEHFADPINAKIFTACTKRIRSGGVADAITLKAEFENSGLLDDVGGFNYIVDLMKCMVGTRYISGYGRAIVEAYVRREMIQAGEALVNRSFGDGQDISAVVAEHMRAMELATYGLVDGMDRQAVSLNDAMDAALADADAMARGEKTLGVSTGMASVDAVIGGMEPGTLNVLAGRPGSGKSALGHKWALNAARAGVGVLEISLEMTATALGRRTLSAAAGIPLAALRAGEHAPYARQLIQARQELHDLPLSIEDGGSMNAADILAKGKAAKKRHGLGLLLVDHLQIVKAEAADIRNGATAMMTAISHTMKAIAKELEIPVILLSQLNRGVESRDDKRPTMGDLRQSGAIEEDADTVGFVYRPELHLSKSVPDQREGETSEKYAARVTDYHDQKSRLDGKAELIFEKVRDGEPIAVPLKFLKASATFAEADQANDNHGDYR
ncbi:MAG: replicative helicase [Rhodoferax sp.]|nr:replicative helicase [Rhodoferax sp.]